MAKDMVDRTEIDVLNWKGVNKNDKKKSSWTTAHWEKSTTRKESRNFPKFGLFPASLPLWMWDASGELTVHYIYIYIRYTVDTSTHCHVLCPKNSSVRDAPVNRRYIGNRLQVVKGGCALRRSHLNWKRTQRTSRRVHGETISIHFLR